MPIELEEPPTIPSALEEGLLERTEPGLLVASGLSRGAKILLHQVEYNFARKTSVFIYPMTIVLFPERIKSLDSQFGEVLPRTAMKEFKDSTPENLDIEFLEMIKPQISDFNHDYSWKGYKILEHSFPYTALNYLKGIISDLKA